MPHPASRLVSVLVLATLTGCGDSTGPSPSTGFYFLTDVNGQPPPILVGATTTCDQLLSRTTLDLADNGSFAFTGQVVSDCTRSGGTTSIAIAAWSGTYEASGGRLVLTPSVPGSPRIDGSYANDEVHIGIPASPQTFPIALSTTFRFVGAPPP